MGVYCFKDSKFIVLKFVYCLPLDVYCFKENTITLSGKKSNVKDAPHVLRLRGFSR